MLEQDLFVLVFAPATVGMVVTALRRLEPAFYWAGFLGIVGAALATLGYRQLGAESIVNGPLIFGLAFLVVPTIAAFSAGRLTVRAHGGSYVFTASCTAYLFGLSAAVVLGFASRLMTP